ncbi:MAG: hypothetical protein IPO83_10150 [Chitinophagaceae bacterium]|nr:hypothetical protein [Chitinophagaceae bacterium]
MKQRLFLMILTTLFSLNGSAYDAGRLRELFYKASRDASAAEVFYNEMKQVTEKDGGILLGYRAMAEFMKCYHSFNPVNKLLYFDKGKDHLNSAVQSDSMNIELRYLRFSVQTNVPVFLGYKENIAQDKQFIMENLGSISNDAALQKMIVSFLLSSNYCSEKEKQQLSENL